MDMLRGGPGGQGQEVYRKTGGWICKRSQRGHKAREDDSEDRGR